nr:SAM-dependent methyltransferase [Alphaproteobacteria bacterium]
NPRVIVLDKTNARHLTQQHLPEPPEVVTCDASFISLKQVLPAALSLSSVNAWLVALIKPQFEVGKNLVGKGGIVREPLLHQQVCQDIQDWVSQQQGWQFLGITDSPITGTDGNREFLLAAQKIMVQNQG